MLVLFTHSGKRCAWLESVKHLRKIINVLTPKLMWDNPQTAPALQMHREASFCFKHTILPDFPQLILARSALHGKKTKNVTHSQTKEQSLQKLPHESISLKKCVETMHLIPLLLLTSQLLGFYMFVEASAIFQDWKLRTLSCVLMKHVLRPSCHYVTLKDHFSRSDRFHWVEAF